MSALKVMSRFKAYVTVNGERFEVTSSMRDTLDAKKASRDSTDELEIVTRIVYFAAKRTGQFEGSWDDFQDSVDEIELESDPVPLVQEAIALKDN